MHAIVVYESHWGNTESVARAIAEGIGHDAVAMTTDEASPSAVRAADLIVAGAPVIAFGLAGQRGVAAIESASEKATRPADLSHPTLRSWLDTLPAGVGCSAAFETRVRWSPFGATGAIEHGLSVAGYRPIAKAGKFVVTGQTGPLRDGELERAREWGAELARSMSVVA